MRARVIDPKHEYYDCSFIVSYLSYNNIAGRGRDSRDIIAATFDEVEFLFDNGWEEEIVNSREILNIKKPKKASYYMYYAILKSIEAYVGSQDLDLFILEETEIASKKVWTKKIIAYAGFHPIQIDVTGQNFINRFDIKVADMDSKDFICECRREKEKLEIGLKDQAKRINGLNYIIENVNNDKVYTSTQELSLEGA